jgi:hypothetical protein
MSLKISFTFSFTENYIPAGIVSTELRVSLREVFSTTVTKWQLQLITINPHRLKTTTTETFCVWYGKLRVQHNSVCRNDISTETVHSVAASISTRVVSGDINNVHFRQASGHYKCSSKHNLQCLLEWSSRNWRWLYYSSTAKYHNHLVRKRFLKETRKLYYLHIHP